jgi:AmmeMemoRadiSam system protein A
MRILGVLMVAAAAVGLWLLGLAWTSDSMPTLTPPDLTSEERILLLTLARQRLTEHLEGGALTEPDRSQLSDALLLEAPCFVTVTKDGRLRGCILDRFEAHEPIVDNVLRNVLLAATRDPRFAPVRIEELPSLSIEISILSPPVPLEFDDADALLAALVPGEDGLILTTAFGTSTYLPQVWDQIPSPEEFLSSLCQKHGAPAGCWQDPPFPDVKRYRVLHFAESDPHLAD